MQALQDEESQGNCLTISTQDSGERIGIFVQDNGNGIPSDKLERIFEPLFSTKSFGVGLGLPIVKQIMEQHNGDIEIQSEADKGTTAILWLPVTQAEGSDK